MPSKELFACLTCKYFVLYLPIRLDCNGTILAQSTSLYAHTIPEKEQYVLLIITGELCKEVSNGGPTCQHFWWGYVPLCLRFEAGTYMVDILMMRRITTTVAVKTYLKAREGRDPERVREPEGMPSFCPNAQNLNLVVGASAASFSFFFSK